MPSFEIASTEVPTEPLPGTKDAPAKSPTKDPLLAGNATIRGVKPSMPARVVQVTPPPVPVTRPMGSAVAPSTVSIPTTIDPDDVEIAEPTDLTVIPVAAERKTSLGLGAIGPDDGLGPVRDTTVMPAEKRPDAVIVDDEPSGDWTMKPGAIEPTPLTGNGIERPRDRQPSGDWTITPTPDSPDGWSEPGTPKSVPAQPPPGPPKSTVASDAPLDSSRRPEPTLDIEQPKVQIDPTLIGPLPDLSDAAVSASGSLPMASVTGGMAPGSPQLMYPTPVPGAMPAPIHPIAPGAIYPTPAPGALAYPATYPTGAQQPYSTGAFASSPSQTGAQPYSTGAFATSPPSQTGAQPYSTGAFASSPATNPGAKPPAGVINPSSHPIGTGPAAAIPGPEQQMAAMGFAPQLVVQESGTSGFFPYATDSQPRMMRAPRDRQRILVIALSAAGVLVVGVALAIVFFGGSSSDPSTDLVAIEPGESNKPATEHPTPPVPDNPGMQPAPGDAGTAAVAPVDAVIEAAKCVVDVSSSPDDAEIVLDKDRVAGRTPMKVELPCNTEAKLLVRKHGYFGVTRTVTPTAAPSDIKVELARAVYQLKVSSTPAGATVTVNGKSGGVTPTTVKVTAFEPTTIVMTKDGFSTETEKLTPKSNNQTVHIALKKKPHR